MGAKKKIKVLKCNEGSEKNKSLLQKLNNCPTSPRKMRINC